MKVLIVKLSSLGDVVQTIPVVSDISRRYPDAAIDWVVEESFAPLLSRVQGLHRVIPIAQRRWRKSRWSAQTRSERAAFTEALHAEDYDAVIDFQGLIKSAWVTRQARLRPGGFSATYANASDACSYEWPVRWLLQRTFPIPKRIHAIARYRLLASLALGYSVLPELRYPLKKPEGAKANVIVFAHGTTRADNEWSQANWVALGRRLVQQGFRIALPQNNGDEQALVQRIAAELDGNADIWPRMGLVQVMDAMALTEGVIGVDSGLSHMAVALDLPHVQIFSQPRAWRAGPVGRAHQVSVGGDFVPDVDAVWNAWRAVS
jgi:heptosyltransferase-1